MEVYDSGSAARVVIPIDIGESSIVSASYRIYNQRHEVLVAPEQLTVEDGATEIEILVPGLVNTLPLGQSRWLLSVEITITNSDGVIRKFKQAYVVQGSAEFQIPGESYQSLEEAILLASEMHDIQGWNRANDAQRRAALLQAANAIDLLNFDLSEATEFPDFPGLDPYRFSSISTLSAQEFNELPGAFLIALKKAQIYEANDALGADPIVKARQQGVVSRTVGESTDVFLREKATRGAVCEAALRILRRFISTKKYVLRG